MEAATYTQVRKNFASVMNRVCDNHDPIIITRQDARPVVMVSLEDYNAIEETFYLLRSPANAARLNKALQDLGNKKYLPKDLIDA
jgi:antitoxin YefM